VSDARCARPAGPVQIGRLQAGQSVLAHGAAAERLPRIGHLAPKNLPAVPLIDRIANQQQLVGQTVTALLQFAVLAYRHSHRSRRETHGMMKKNAHIPGSGRTRELFDLRSRRR
jgi:hypothetical protein